MSLGSPIMSSPSTPTSGGRNSDPTRRLINYSFDKPAPPDFGKLASSGPSPASTAGDTHSAGSFPATPMDKGDMGPARSDIHSSSRYAPDRFGDGLDSSSPSVKESTELGTVSSSSLSKLDESLASDTEDTGTSVEDMVTQATNSYIKSKALEQVSPSPSPGLRRSVSGFVQGSTLDIDDPFTTAPSRVVLDALGKLISTSTTSISVQTPTRRTQSANVTPNHRASKAPFSHITPTHSSGDPSTKFTNALPNESPFSPREERLGETPSADNAQAIFPPEACVFVANLSSTCSDEVLDKAVTELFGRFGTVYVKIRRDSRGMPYAFCQYETKEVASLAIMGGKDKLIAGRPCRTEISKAHRALYVSKHDGSSITAKEVRELLAERGELDKVWTSTDTECEIYQLPPGMWVRFHYYQDCQDARANLRHHPLYKVEVVVEPMKGSATRSMRNSAMNGSPTDAQFSPTAARGDDGRTIFVGNLPLNINQQELCSLFSSYGEIVTAQVVSNVRNVQRMVVYGFVEFGTYQSAFAAVRGESGKIIRGFKIKVEHNHASMRQRQMPYPPHSAQDMGYFGYQSNGAFPPDPRSMGNNNAMPQFYPQQPAYPEQFFPGNMQNGYADPSLAMYFGPQDYAYWPPTMHPANDATHGMAGPQGSGMHTGNAAGFHQAAGMNTQLAPDWFMPAGPRQMQSYAPNSMQGNPSGPMQYAQGPMSFTPYPATFHPRPVHERPAQRPNNGTDNGTHNATSTSQPAAPVVESH